MSHIWSIVCDETNALCSFLNEGDNVGEDSKRSKYLWMCARGFVGLSACTQCIFCAGAGPRAPNTVNILWNSVQLFLSQIFLGNETLHPSLSCSISWNKFASLGEIPRMRSNPRRIYPFKKIIPERLQLLVQLHAQESHARECFQGPQTLS